MGTQKSWQKLDVTNKVVGCLYDFHNDDLVTFTKKVATTRKCEICKKNIYKVYKVELDKKTNSIVSSVCVWDQYYTCSEKCYNKRIENYEEIEVI